MKQIKRTFIILLSWCFLLGLCIPLQGQPLEPVNTEKVTETVFCISGPGGNIGVLTLEKGSLVVDAKYSKTAPEVLKEIKKLSPGPILYLINTHYHGDHTDGNPIIGAGAIIVSHSQCKSSLLRRLTEGESPDTIGAPQMTYSEKMTLHFENETVHLFHFGPAHTAGDTVVVFEKARVVHTGDLFFHNLPPFIDVEDGSDTGNWVKTIRKLATDYGDYKVIPGHGPVSDMKEFLKFGDYLHYLRQEVSKAIKEGKSATETVDSIDVGRFSYLKDKGEFLTKKNNISWIYAEMSR
ncbi:MBL fold metallo-hydrolase [candidate division CSSED10-310 bacterium]|uniref:MBL fold metallo-hydrolase n=1 Tax=candidate division CSSED10-310 bacterium TaxID=2855610 RepID=A0ABV6Z1F5_UNCC1